MSPKNDLLLAIVSHRVVSAPTVSSLWVLNKLPPPFPRVELGMFIGDALISRGRSQACSKFLLETDTPYMLFIDDDIVFNPQDIQKIYNHLCNGYDVIGGIYPVKGASQLSSYGWGGHLQIDGKVAEIEYLATGFMGISRRILTKLKDELNLPILNPNDWSKCYPFFECGRWTKRTQENSDPIYISEDWEFCEKVRQVGGKIYADTAVQVGHMREQIFHPKDVLEVQGKTIMEQKVYGAMRKQQDLILSVDTDLSEFLHLPVKKVQEEMCNAQKTLAEQWNKHKGAVRQFYTDNTAYLYDLAAFNRHPIYYQQRVAGLLNIAGLKILDIGCGVGTAVFMLHDQGNTVVGWDINKQAIEFCKYKKKKYKLGGTFTTQQPDFSQFDLIIAIDTLEHIQNLHNFLLILGKKMKRGARFYHSDYFPKDETWPMHFEEHAQHLSQWLQEAGFVEWEANSTWAIKS